MDEASSVNWINLPITHYILTKSFATVAPLAPNKYVMKYIKRSFSDVFSFNRLILFEKELFQIFTHQMNSSDLLISYPISSLRLEMTGTKQGNMFGCIGTCSSW